MNKAHGQQEITRGQTTLTIQLERSQKLSLSIEFTTMSSAVVGRRVYLIVTYKITMKAFCLIEMRLMDIPGANFKLHYKRLGVLPHIKSPVTKNESAFTMDFHQDTLDVSPCKIAYLCKLIIIDICNILYFINCTHTSIECNDTYHIYSAYVSRLGVIVPHKGPFY